MYCVASDAVVGQDAAAAGGVGDVGGNCYQRNSSIQNYEWDRYK